MIDETDAQLALRNRALSLTIATTGSAMIGATATAFTRSSGSFLTDGFKVGMEIVSAGFGVTANNGVGIILSLTATVMAVSMFVVTVSGGVQSVTRPATAVEAETAARTIAARIPSMRAFESTVTPGLTVFKPEVFIPYIAEEFIPAPGSLKGSKTGGDVYESGLYILTWYGLPGVGISALRKSVGVLKLLYAPGTKLTAGSHTLRIRGETMPYTGQIIPLNGWAALQLTIPWYAYSVNAIAA